MTHTLTLIDRVDDDYLIFITRKTVPYSYFCLECYDMRYFLIFYLRTYESSVITALVIAGLSALNRQRTFLSDEVLETTGDVHSDVGKVVSVLPVIISVKDLNIT